VIACHDADDVRPGSAEQALDFGVARVDAEDQVAIFGLGADQELGRVGQGCCGHERHAQMLGRSNCHGKRLLRL
jgi:hypothetical protein